ncbi:MAG: hypothetical protein H7315_19640 [Herminiimonas sp.]|nr:hypothetical protein [Herminiimonas sp.]
MSNNEFPDRFSDDLRDVAANYPLHMELAQRHKPRIHVQAPALLNENRRP